MPLYLSELAAGGNGVVYRLGRSVPSEPAWIRIEPPLKRKRDAFDPNVVVVKVSRQPTVSGRRNDATEEARFLRGMAHPNVVEVTALLECTGRDQSGDAVELTGIVMPRAHASLHTTRRDGPVGLHALARDVLRGVAHFHDMRHIHGDVTPGNVLLGADGTWRLCDTDFVAEIGLPTPAMEMGTPYTSRPPETVVRIMEVEAGATSAPLPEGMSRDILAGVEAQLKHQARPDSFLRDWIEVVAMPSHDLWGVGGLLFFAATKTFWAGRLPKGVGPRDWVTRPMLPEHRAITSVDHARQLERLRDVYPALVDMVGEMKADDPTARPSARQLLARLGEDPVPGHESEPPPLWQW